MISTGLFPVPKEKKKIKCNLCSMLVEEEFTAQGDCYECIKEARDAYWRKSRNASLDGERMRIEKEGLEI